MTQLTASLCLQALGPPEPKVADPRAKERQDVNQLVSDLIGTSPAKSPRSTLAARARSPETSGAGAAQQQQGEEVTPTPTPPRVQKRAVNLVVDTLASINIKPRVSEGRGLSLHTLFHCAYW